MGDGIPNLCPFNFVLRSSIRTKQVPDTVVSGGLYFSHTDREQNSICCLSVGETESCQRGSILESFSVFLLCFPAVRMIAVE